MYAFPARSRTFSFSFDDRVMFITGDGGFRFGLVYEPTARRTATAVGCSNRVVWDEPRLVEI